MFPLLLALLATPTGDAVLRIKHGSSEIVLTTTKRLAGAVHSITWAGQEFIDSLDHGRQLQSACAFDCRKSPFWAESYNPTEAGSRKDHTGPTSSSRLMEFAATETTLRSRTRMAFWLAPGELSSGRPALNNQVLSDHILVKSISLHPGWIEYEVNFIMPRGEKHLLAQFEAVTGYMPPTFSIFETFNVNSGELHALNDGPGEQSRPIVFSTTRGTHAMGVIALDAPAPGVVGPAYGRWRFQNEKVVKWNAVYRVRDNDSVPPGDYRFRLAVAIGSRDDVRAILVRLLKKP